ncbi:uncharacterized protein LOC125036706 isoform X1 [Penaeus chinensis]|uniref:uncharacterized protein LOC125036706 isoform X1 n=1 Tax=Penaeus chinensis TaxID=139456 RepID=UPI001FB804C5|nr:uncharacterized protein LOC125036706 isoform X1 [Penaeus chinensis]XP_047485483.1 uncharacterized protein LOC125036706 isoform X1 [Penaeus chinensis]
MQSLKLIFVVLALAGTSSACKYFCKSPVTQEYECCDDGNPYYNPEEDEGVTAEVVPVDLPAADLPSGPSSNCYYYCAYDGEVYCCGDVSRPIPESHDDHDGKCADEADQVCKSTGIFFLSKAQAKTSGAIQLFAGSAKEEPSCASDGYCAQDQKCCASKCVRRHICMKALEEDEKEDDSKKA